MHVQVLSLLALRRLHSAQDVLVGSGAPASSPNLRELIPGREDLCTSASRVWLTLELLIRRSIVAPRLESRDAELFAALQRQKSFEQLFQTRGRFLQQWGEELHAARTTGPLSIGDVDPDELLRQLEAFASEPAERLQDLEWDALWELSDSLQSAGFPALRSVCELRSGQGRALLVDLMASFVAHELEAAREGEPFLDPTQDGAAEELGLLPAGSIGWLARQSEQLDALLDDSTPRPVRRETDDPLARVRQGVTLAQRGSYEQAIVEFTLAIQSGTTAAYLHRGDVYRLRGDYPRAIDDYSAAIQAEPGSVLAHVHRGMAYRQTGQFDASVDDFAEAIRRDVKCVAAFTNRGEVLAQRGRFDDAIADFTEAVRLDPHQPWAFQSRGDAFAGQREYDRAIADYTQALRLSPHFPLALANRGDAYRLKGDLDRAAADFTEALRLDPANPRLYTSRGDVYRRTKHYELALVDFSEAIRLDDKNPSVYLNRGIALQEMGEYDQAVADFDRAEQYDPANPEVLVQRALAHQTSEDYASAIVDLSKAIQLNPRDAAAYRSRGNLQALLREFEPAIADFSEAIAIDPDTPQTYLDRARTFAQLGQFERTLEDSEAAIERNPEFAPARLVRGGALLRLGHYDAALEEFNETIRINSRYAKAYNDRGATYSKLGQLDEAVEDFSRAIRIEPKYAQAHANRGTANQILKRHDQALHDFTQAVTLDSKYAPAYCVQRGLAQLSRGELDAAIADYTVALVLDPNNRLALSGLEEAERLRGEQTFDLADQVWQSSATAEPAFYAPRAEYAPPAADENSVPVGEERHAQEPTAVEEPVAESPAPEPVSTGLVDTDFEMSVPTLELPEPERTEEEEAAYAEEQRLFAIKEAAKEAERRRGLLEEFQKKEAAKQTAEKAKARKLRPEALEEDEDELAAKKKRWRSYAIIGVAAAVLAVMFGGDLLSMVLPEAQLNELPAAKLAAEFAEAPDAAFKRYGNRSLVVVGKLTAKRATGPAGTAPTILFDVSGNGEPVECEFEDIDQAQDIAGAKLAAETRVVGRIERRADGGLILRQAVNLGNGSS